MMFRLLIVILAVPVIGLAQSADSVLLLERSIDRSLTLHKGQIRIEAGYGLSTITKRFDDEGSTIKLSEEGLSYNRHAFVLDARYGIFDNLQIGVSTFYKRQSKRTEQVLILNEGLTRLFEIQNTTGFDDVLVTLTGRAPFTPKALDILVSGGIYIPTGSDEDTKPHHTYSAPEDGYNGIQYEYNQKWGSGAMVALMGGTIKYRLRNFAFTGSASYDYPLSTSKNVRWEHQLVDDKFEYQSSSYTYQLPATLHVQVEIERQLTNWLDLSIIAYGEQSKGGWDEVNNAKFQRPDRAFYSINPGYEILVTSKIWLRQRVIIPVAGKNAESLFGIQTSLVYNFFPF